MVDFEFRVTLVSRYFFYELVRPCIRVSTLGFIFFIIDYGCHILWACYNTFVASIYSATSRCILVPFEWYGHPKKWAQKSSCNTFSIYTSGKTYMKYSLQILKNENFFKRLTYPSPNALNIKYFWHSATIIGGFWVSLNYPILNFKKMIWPKKHLDAAQTHKAKFFCLTFQITDTTCKY